jgi:benzoyl-CoA-dihydrodiol lyase
VAKRAQAIAATSDRPKDAKGIALTPIARTIEGDKIDYGVLAIALDRAARTATLTLRGPDAPPPADAAGVHAQGAAFWPLALARALDDAILHLRSNETEIGVWVFKTEGDADQVAAYDALLQRLAGDWLGREILLYWKRTLKRLDVTSRSMIALVEPGSCFTGFCSNWC